MPLTGGLTATGYLLPHVQLNHQRRYLKPRHPANCALRQVNTSNYMATFSQAENAVKLFVPR